jgi:hypothetical protein
MIVDQAEKPTSTYHISGLLFQVRDISAAMRG